MKVIDKKPETPEIKTCDKHGDYEVKYSRISETRCWVFDSCRTCIDEAEVKAKLKEEKENAERDIENKIRSTAGRANPCLIKS